MTTTTYAPPKAPRKKYPRLEVWRAPVHGWNVARLSDPIHGRTEHFPTFDNALAHVRHLIDEHDHVKRVREMGVS